MFGLITIFSIKGHILIEGRFFDFRHITMTMAGFIGGPFTAAIAAFISALYRFNAGGSGSMGGYANIIIFACFGSILGKHLRSNQNGKKVFFWFTTGIIMAIILLVIIAFIPQWKSDSATVLRTVSAPYLIITPLATTIILNFYFLAYNFLTKASILNTIIYQSPINLIIFSTKGPILVSKNLENQQKFSRNVEGLLGLGSEEKIWINTPKQQQRKISTGDEKYFVADLSSFHMPNGERACVAIINDVTDQKRKQEELKVLYERLQKYQVLAERAKDAMLFIDKQGNILEVNNAAVKIYGYTYKEFLSLTIFELRRVDKSSDIVEQMELADKEGIIFETVHYLKDGTSMSVEISSQATVLGNKRVLLCIVRDISERKKREDENCYLSYHDVLTGLYNRRFCEEEIKRLDTETNLPISIIIGDVNGLKLVNDAFGHDKGDELLCKAATAIQSACKESDIIARWGGDEFVVLLPKTETEGAEKTITRIKELYLNEHVNAIRVSISFGWATKKRINEDIMKVLKSAEDYMYRHKIVENEGVRGNSITTIINTLNEKNPREKLHSQRVSLLCHKIGRAIGLTDLEVSRLKVVGLLHDIGKIAIEENILNKSGKLTENEWEEIKRHPEIGYRILSSSNEMLDLADCILAHHERWDGTGYPKGLKGEAIPLASRIIALADSYDAMISDRSYRKALSEEEVLREIRKSSGTQFDPEITKLFMEKVLLVRSEAVGRELLNCR